MEPAVFADVPWFLRLSDEEEYVLDSEEFHKDPLLERMYMIPAATLKALFSFVGAFTLMLPEVLDLIVQKVSSLDSEIGRVIGFAKGLSNFRINVPWLDGRFSGGRDLIADVWKELKLSMQSFFNLSRGGLVLGSKSLVHLRDYHAIEKGDSLTSLRSTPVSTVIWGGDDFGQIVESFGAKLLFGSQSNVHKIEFNWNEYAVGLVSGVILPDGSYKLSYGEPLEIVINDQFVPEVASHLERLGIPFDESGILFAPYVIVFDGIVYEQQMLAIGAECSLEQFRKEGLHFRVDYEVASLVKGIEILYRWNEEYFCLGSIINGDADQSSSSIINIRLPKTQ